MLSILDQSKNMLFGKVLNDENIEPCSDKGGLIALPHNSFSKQRISDSSKLEEFADDNFKLNENGRNISKKVENTVGKGEIAC